MLLMHFVWHLIFAEYARGEADCQTRKEKGHFPVLQPGHRYSAPASLEQLWTVQHSTRTRGQTLPKLNPGAAQYREVS